MLGQSRFFFSFFSFSFQNCIFIIASFAKPAEYKKKNKNYLNCILHLQENRKKKIKLKADNMTLIKLHIIFFSSVYSFWYFSQIVSCAENSFEIICVVVFVDLNAINSNRCMYHHYTGAVLLRTNLIFYLIKKKNILARFYIFLIFIRLLRTLRVFSFVYGIINGINLFLRFERYVQYEWSIKVLSSLWARLLYIYVYSNVDVNKCIAKA